MSRYPTNRMLVARFFAAIAEGRGIHTSGPENSTSTSRSDMVEDGNPPSGGAVWSSSDAIPDFGTRKSDRSHPAPTARPFGHAHDIRLGPRVLSY
ncbi:unnamed protein product [Aspergillus oryzae]|nr:unnamed protein product [Aspergillus oryzae]GMF95834.1 unnamed protein product [Aspergillus oryzae]